MKKSVLVLALAALFFASCGEKKKDELKKEVETPVEEVTNVATETAKGPAEYLALGEKLFTEKTCATCHQADTKVIGPSIKEISKVYTEKNANIVAFLNGETPAIVDTDPGQVAIMKANLDGFVKDLTSEEKAALAVYMASKK
ncbi:c-type cytochrome [Lutibacter sp.]|uniref:c-type cytochrome n=1 Tax=Lutibacter sp. TaxID=1925666 RepID=UPI001A23B19B|nr:c-type cytochrome [Lutibacter sp.]MBI9041466.1 c-type cytochrome [Lutibacter sp.]